MIPVLNEGGGETFESYNSGMITLDDIDILSECRLIVSAAESLEVRGRAICYIGEDAFEVVTAHGDVVSLIFGSYSFTRVGAQLASTIIIGKAADAAEQTRKWLEANALDGGEIIMRPLASR